MPIPGLTQIPKSLSAEEFENVCVDVLSAHYCQEFSIFGRRGQKQNGIDMFTKMEDGCVVAQCKNYYSEDSSKRLVDSIKKDIIEAAKQIDFPIIRFIAMTSMNIDVNVQKEIIKMNSNSGFSISIWFWEEIQKHVCDNVQIFRRYYSCYFGEQEISIESLNEAIVNINNLKNLANYFNHNYKRYRAYNNDVAVYNQCVSMMNSILKLQIFRNQFYLQLDKSNNKIHCKIEQICKSQPDFYDATQDWTGVHMVCTIDNYNRYFFYAGNYNRFIKNCDKLIELLKNVK